MIDYEFEREMVILEMMAEANYKRRTKDNDAEEENEQEQT